MAAKTKLVERRPSARLPFNNSSESTSLEQEIVQPGSGKLAIIIQQGKVLDFIDGKTQRPETPEEYVRQEIAKSLVREYRYEKATIAVEFTIPVGSRKPRADLVIFPPGAAHKKDDALIIVECKAMSHPVFGRPLVKALAYGSSIPEIEVADITAFNIVRLNPSKELEIAELAEASARARAAADILEREIASDAGAIIDKFLTSDSAETNGAEVRLRS